MNLKNCNMSQEEKIQENIIGKLQSRDLNPFSVIFSYEAGDPGGMLSITFFLREEMMELLDILKYKKQCDKSGWVIIEKTNTIILSGIALLHVYGAL